MTTATKIKKGVVGTPQVPREIRTLAARKAMTITLNVKSTVDRGTFVVGKYISRSSSLMAIAAQANDTMKKLATDFARISLTLSGRIEASTAIKKPSRRNQTRNGRRADLSISWLTLPCHFDVAAQFLNMRVRILLNHNPTAYVPPKASSGTTTSTQLSMNQRNIHNPREGINLSGYYFITKASAPAARHNVGLRGVKC